MKALNLLLGFIVLLSSCRKDDEDTITTQNINGMVYNQCTDSGLAGVKVYLKINKNNSSFQSFEATSGINGGFSFNGVGIHSNSNYSYALYIASISGIGGGVGFEGTSMEFNYDQANVFFKPKIIPCFYQLNIILNNSMTTSPSDSLIAQFKQEIFHKNVPELPYNITPKFYGNQSSSYLPYPTNVMGLRKIIIDKWVGGIHTTTLDSIYLGWGDTKTYTINW